MFSARALLPDVSRGYLAGMIEGKNFTAEIGLSVFGMLNIRGLVGRLLQWASIARSSLLASSIIAAMFSGKVSSASERCLIVLKLLTFTGLNRPECSRVVASLNPQGSSGDMVATTSILCRSGQTGYHSKPLILLVPPPRLERGTSRSTI
jgi:hypothetical protein